MGKRGERRNPRLVEAAAGGWRLRSNGETLPPWLRHRLIRLVTVTGGERLEERVGKHPGRPKEGPGAERGVSRL